MDTKLTKTEKWWSQKSLADREKISGLPYPDSTRWWQSLPERRRIAIMNKEGGYMATPHHTRPKDMQSYT